MTEERTVGVYGKGELKDEGGRHHYEKVQEPDWVKKAQKHCAGCRDNFYNGRMNCTGNTWCMHLKPEYANINTKPPCFER